MRERRRGSNGSGGAAAGARKPYAALQGVGRAIEILEALAERPMRASEVADRLGFKWTTTHRALAHLLERAYLRRDGASGVYSVGPRLYLLGQRYLADHPLVAAGSEAVRALAVETGADVQLCERVGLQAAVLVSVDPKVETIPMTTPWFHFPLHTGSKGQVLLAFSEPSVLEELLERPLPALTERTIVDPEALREAVAHVRAAGYAVTREDVQLGTGSVAAPVFAAGGELAGCVTAIVKAEELSEERTAELVGAVVRTARAIALRLGWRHGDPSGAAAPRR